MLTITTQYTYTLISGETITIPQHVIQLYEAHNMPHRHKQMDAVACIKWLRVQLGLGLLEGKRLHEILVARIHTTL